MFSAEDAPLSGNNLPSILFDFVYSARFTEGTGLAELVVFHESQVENVGVSADHTESGDFEICCSVYSFSKGECTIPDRIALNLNVSRSQDTLFYFSQLLNSFSNTTFSGFVETNMTGFWYLYLMNCDHSSGQTVQVKGKSNGLNVYGFLPATAYGNLVLFWVFAFVYTALFVVYIARLIRWKNHMQRMHQYMGILLFVSALNYIWLGTHYSVFNSVGKSNDILASLSVSFSAIRATLVRIIILLVALGHQITMEALTPVQYTGMFVLFGFYFFISGVENYWRFATLIGLTVSLWSLVITGVANAILNVIYIVWVLWGLRDRNQRIRTNKEEEEAELDMMYKKLLLFFGVAIIFCFAFWIAEVSLDASGNRDNVFQWLWLIYSYWHWAYLFLIIFLSWEWRPGSDNARYAYDNLVDKVESAKVV